MYHLEHIDHDIHLGVLFLAIQILFEQVYSLYQQYLLDLIHPKNLFYLETSFGQSFPNYPCINKDNHLFLITK